ncbi:MAG: NAD(P)-dependent glycerol-3-phosphate dehydrogenase [Anaerolineales bacterium]|nr:NAD(P)-dependent glycerol-3-phosphate dehydrogenase [Anaerolineales bacterium]MCB9128460.1 NAD(P)-dependent glycerol-3-phosphate dehydrogenase [Ardenticatenales bacterium]
MAEKIAVIGSGSWGTTLAILQARAEREVWLWTRSAEEAETLNSRRENSRFLPGVALPDALHISADAAEVLRDAALVLLVAPSQHMRANVQALRDHFPQSALLLSCAKGLELATMKRMTTVIREELPPEMAARVGALSGPNIAREIVSGLPASTVVAMDDHALAEQAQHLLNTPEFRVYTQHDLVGVEMCGALKNIIAIGAGAADQLAVGDNAKATYLTRGLAEITRLGTAAGASPLTFAGLAGLGDLLCTCNSVHSRNHHVGVELAKGRSLDEIRDSMTQIAEGVYTIKAARELAAQHHVELPITDLLYAVLYEGRSAQGMVRELMTRNLKHELAGLDS